MRVLVTGFGPFADIRDNPSERIVAILARDGLPGHRLLAEVFPVSYRAGAEGIQRLLSEERPDIALLMGVSARAESVRLERRAFNADGLITDVGGGTVARRHGVPDVLWSPVDIDNAIHSLTQQGHRVRASADPGRYVCNHVYYAGLLCCERHGLPTRTLFAHVPLPTAQSGPDSANAEAGCLESVVSLIQALIERLSTHMGGTSGQAGNT